MMTPANIPAACALCWSWSYEAPSTFSEPGPVFLFSREETGLERGLCLSEPWFAPLENVADNIPSSGRVREVGLGLALGGLSLGNVGRKRRGQRAEEGRSGWFPGRELQAIPLAHPALQGETQALLHK